MNNYLSRLKFFPSRKILATLSTIVFLLGLIVLNTSSRVSAHVISPSCTSAGIGLDIRGEFQGTDDEAAIGRHGDVLDYKITVSLTSSQCPITDGVVKLTLPNGGLATLDSSLSLASGGSKTYDATGNPYTIAHVDEGTNGAPAGFVRALGSVSATSHRASGIDQQVGANANFDTKVIHPSTTLTKAADPTSGRAPLIVVYTYKEKNDGDDPIGNVHLSDDKCSPVVPKLGGDGVHNIGDINNDNVLDPGETWEFTCKATLTETTTNIATAGGTASDRRDAPNEEARATVNVIKPHTTLTKEANPTSGRAPLSVTYTYKETNDGNDPISNVVVTDDKCAPVKPTLGIDGIHNVGDTNNNGLLDPGETWIFTCKATLTETTTNIATASGTASDQRDAPEERAEATVKVFTVETRLTKSANPTSGVAPLTVTYTYNETNTGTSPIANVSLSDDLCSPVVYQSGDVNNNNLLDPGETWVFQCTQTFNIAGTFTNHVVATGTATLDKKPAPEERAEATVVVKEAPQGCTLTQGFWKNHPDAWPVKSLTLGTHTYTQAELLKILKTPVRGNGLISLAHQLIAAKLNIASGASSSSIAATIASADALIGGKVVPPVGSGFLLPSSTSSLTGALDNYNSGLTGPGHCAD